MSDQINLQKTATVIVRLKSKPTCVEVSGVDFKGIPFFVVVNKHCPELTLNFNVDFDVAID